MKNSLFRNTLTPMRVVFASHLGPILIFFLAASSRAQPAPERQADRAAIMASLCQGKADGGDCNSCGKWNESEVFWSMGEVYFGHFLSARSDDAIVGINGCHSLTSPGDRGLTVLVSRRSGKWEEISDVEDLVVSDCHRMRFRDGRDLLIYRPRAGDSEESHSLLIFSAADDELKVDTLFTAWDTICVASGTTHKGSIDKVSFLDVNGDGQEDISIAASLGTLPETPAITKQCTAAQEGRPGAVFPKPAAIRKYKIDFLFDGATFTPSRETAAARKLFDYSQ